MTAVYAMVTELSGRARYVKFGLAGDPHHRMRNVQCGCPLRIETLLYVECPSPEAAAKLEAALHVEHQEQHTSGEWFVWEAGTRAKADAAEALSLVGQREIGPMEVRCHDFPGHAKRKPRALARYRTFGRRAAALPVVGDADLSSVRVAMKRKRLIRNG